MRLRKYCKTMHRKNIDGCWHAIFKVDVIIDNQHIINWCLAGQSHRLGQNPNWSQWITSKLVRVCVLNGFSYSPLHIKAPEGSQSYFSWLKVNLKVMWRVSNKINKTNTLPQDWVLTLQTYIHTHSSQENESTHSVSAWMANGRTGAGCDHI